MNRATTLQILLLLMATAGGAAELDRAVTAEDGWVHVAYAAREGVHTGEGDVTIEGGEVHLDDGLVHVTLRVRDGSVDRLEVRAGHRPQRRERMARNLGEVDAAVAATYLLDLARTTVDAEMAEKALTAAALADAETWPELLTYARDRDRPHDVRETAIFWLGVAAGDKAANELEAIVVDESEDIEIREHAVFALHQAVEDDIERTVETLGRIATENPHPQIRRSALFWLAQHDDPAVIDLFEAILLD